MTTITRTLSEDESARLVVGHGVPVVASRRAATPAEAVEAADAIGYPVVVKLHADAIAHKSERGLVRVGLTDAGSVAAAATDLLAVAVADDGDVDLLVAPMLSGLRELVAGVHTDPQFGPTVMVGIGGVLTEAVGDVVFRLVPIDVADALDMIDDLQHPALLEPFRGEPAVDRDALAAVLLGLSDLAASTPDIVAIDLNPLVVVDGRPIAVDALVEVAS